MDPAQTGRTPHTLRRNLIIFTISIVAISFGTRIGGCRHPPPTYQRHNHTRSTLGTCFLHQYWVTSCSHFT